VATTLSFASAENAKAMQLRTVEMSLKCFMSILG